MSARCKGGQYIAKIFVLVSGRIETTSKYPEFIIGGPSGLAIISQSSAESSRQTMHEEAYG